MVLTSTCAVAPTALAVVHGNGATAEIAQVLHLAEQVFSTRPQLLQRLIHSASNLNDYKHSDYRPKKERAQLVPTNLTRTSIDEAAFAQLASHGTITRSV